MICNTKRFGFGILLASFLLSLSSSSQAQADADPDLKKQVEELKKITEKLTDLQKTVDATERNSKSIDRMQKDMEDLRRDVNYLTEQMKNMIETSRLLTEQNKKMTELLDTKKSTSRRMDLTDKAEKMANVKFSNSSFMEVSVRVNNNNFRLLPGEQTTVAIPAGKFTYQIFPIQVTRQTREIGSDETKTITIEP